MTIGLDLGSHQFRSLRYESGQLVARCCAAIFTSMSDTTTHRRLLEQSNTRFATCSDQLLVFGDAAREWSAVLNLTLSPLLRGGCIPVSDPVVRQLLTLMIDALLPLPRDSDSECCMTLPGGGQDERISNNDAGFFRQVVSLRGYRPQVVTATQALALAELNDDLFTGIAVTIGHTTCEFGVVHCGRELVRCVVMAGLDSFEGMPALGGSESAIGATAPSDRNYLRFFTDAVTEARIQFEQDGTLMTLAQPLPVICAGGITSAPAFLPLFLQAWTDAQWPVATKPVRIASDSNLAVVRGCLIQAELDQPRERYAA